MKCNSCGKEYDSGNYCPNCGAKSELPDSSVCDEIKENYDETPTQNLQDDKCSEISSEKVNAKPAIILSILKILKKRWIWGIIAGIIIIVLIPCLTHKSDEVKECIRLIDSVCENVNINSDTAILRAEKCYEKLSKSDKRKVNNYDDLLEAKDKCDDLIADMVEIKIDELNEKSDLSDIQWVRSSYENLTDNQKKFVDNLSVLEEYEESYYDDMIAETIKKIDSINYSGGEVSTELEKAIDDAERSYNQIDDNYKDKVTNYDKLQKVKEDISAHNLKNAQNLINDSIKNGKGFSKAEEAYYKLTDEQKQEITNYDEFTKQYDAFKNKSPLKLISYSITPNIIGTPQFTLIAKNDSDQIIKSFSVTLFAFDKDGLPLQVDYSDYYNNMKYGSALKVGESTSSNKCWTLYGAPQNEKMEYIVIIVKSVEYFDGSTWTNPNYGSLFEKYNQQILAKDDPNILRK